jgi:hypothetical protein
MMAFTPNHDLVEELKWRGLLHDAMPGTQDLLNREMVTGYVGFWDLANPRTWALSSASGNAGTLAGNVLTCATGVTYTSSLFSGWGDGSKGNVCDDEQDTSYFAVGFNGNGAGISGPGTIVISIPAGFLTAPTTSGTSTFQAYALESGTPVRTNFTVTVAEGAPDIPTTDPPSVPFELSLTPDDGTVCAQSSASAAASAWLSLPGAGDCTPPVTTPDAKLLGWATSSDFPVSIAERQVERGWGAYEIFNDEGQITSVFIPAGRATFLSGTNTLHPIWSD